MTVEKSHWLLCAYCHSLSFCFSDILQSSQRHWTWGRTPPVHEDWRLFTWNNGSGHSRSAIPYGTYHVLYQSILNRKCFGENVVSHICEILLRIIDRFAFQRTVSIGVKTVTSCLNPRHNWWIIRNSHAAHLTQHSLWWKRNFSQSLTRRMISMICKISKSARSVIRCSRMYKGRYRAF